MKVKHFSIAPETTEEFTQFEEAINKFIKNKNVIDIKYSSSGFGYSTRTDFRIIEHDKFLYSALVMYEENND